MARRYRRLIGDILKIDLGDGTHTYAQVSTNPLVVFFNLKTSTDLSADQAAALPIAFKLWVMNSDLRAWERVGNAVVEPSRLDPPVTFKQDFPSGRLSLYHHSFETAGGELPCKLSDCLGLERAAVWNATHVEDRLRDHFAGVENMWVKSLAIKEDKVPLDQRG